MACRCFLACGSRIAESLRAEVRTNAQTFVSFSQFGTVLSKSLTMTLDDLYEEYESPLQRYANSLIHDTDSADDLVQETFIRSLGHLSLLAMLEPAQRRAWLKRTLKNLFIDSQRSAQRQARLVQQLEVREVVSEQETFGQVLMPDLLGNMADDVRELFEMRYTLGMNSSEIGEQLGIPAATVRSRLHFEIQKLQRYRSNWE